MDGSASIIKKKTYGAQKIAQDLDKLTLFIHKFCGEGGGGVALNIFGNLLVILPLQLSQIFFKNTLTYLRKKVCSIHVEIGNCHFIL